MNSLYRYFYKHRIIIPNEEKLNRWIADNKLDDLQFAAKIGNYKMRLLLIEKLSFHLEEENVLAILLDFVDDKVPLVSEKAIDVLRKMLPNMNSQLEKVLTEKEEYWEEQKNKPKAPTRKVKFDQTWKDNEDKMVRLKQVRQQLRKSMCGERWT